MEDNTFVWLLFAGPEHMREMPSRACRRHANSLLRQSSPSARGYCVILP